MQASEKIKKARAGLVLDHWFFGSLALRPVLREDPNCDTAATNGETLKYNPAFVDGLSLDAVKGMLAHEVLHVGLCHHTRRGSRDPRKLNIACDYPINNILQEAGFTLPPNVLVGQYQGMSAEAIYSLLPDDTGEGQGDQDPGGCGGVEDAPGQDGPASATEMAQAESEAKVNMAQAAQAAKSAGALPAGLAKLIGDLLETRVPWREVLRRFIDQTSHNDYSWTRPNYRYLASGIYLPSLYSQEMAPIAVGADMSGSVDDQGKAQFAGELTAIIEETRAHATVFYFDTEVGNVQEFGPDSLPLVLDTVGGGGTDYRPVFEEIERRGDTPRCLIMVTDGYCSRYPDPPEYPVLWAITPEYRDFNPPFGEVIQIIP